MKDLVGVQVMVHPELTKIPQISKDTWGQLPISSMKAVLLMFGSKMMQ
ncbi:Uncharacterised protein [Sphingobacterium daejeonense]|nr:Uncharacterised protein [Sphingobacterium daejeonense]